MAPLRVKQLQAHFYQDFAHGMQWETEGEISILGKKNYRVLLHYPSSIRISKVITKGLKPDKPLVVSRAFGDIYFYATAHIDECHDLEPKEFFGRAKDSSAWSKPMTNDEFWAFTYKAFHARSLYLGTVLHQDETPIEEPQPLAEALDVFRQAFLERYPIDAAKIGYNDETLDQNKKIHEKYFPHHLTHHTAEGDGTDKLITTLKRFKTRARCSPHEDLSLANVPDHELFFYDTKGKASQYANSWPVAGSRDRSVDEESKMAMDSAYPSSFPM